MELADTRRRYTAQVREMENAEYLRPMTDCSGYAGAISNTPLPSFIVAGPPRTGTTWLHEVLNPYVNLPAPTKETRFFDDHFHRGLKWYRSHFPKMDADKLIGEVAPTYFASADARQHIVSTIPLAKLIFIFRNPVQRVISLYRIKRAYGLLPWTFDEALERDPELIGSGMYSTHLTDWRRKFSDEQILIAIYDDLRSEPQGFVDRIAAFIGLPSITLTESQSQRIHSSEKMTQPRCYLATKTATAFAEWCKSRALDNVVASVRNSAAIRLFLGGGAPFPEVSPAAVRRLAEVFRPEVDGLETLLNRDLSAWKTSH